MPGCQCSSSPVARNNTYMLPAPKLRCQILTSLLSSSSLLSISIVMSSRHLKLSLYKAELSVFLLKPAAPSLRYFRNGNSILLGAQGPNAGVIPDYFFLFYPITVHQGMSLLPATRSPINGLWLNRRDDFRDGTQGSDSGVAQCGAFHTCLLCTPCCWPSTSPKETRPFVKPCAEPKADTGEDRKRGG